MFKMQTVRGLSFGLACMLGGLLAGCGDIAWERDHQAGLRRAVQSRKRALIEFTAGFDEGASKMDGEVFTNPDVQDLMKQFVPIRLDANMNRSLAEQFGIQKTPAFVVIRPDMSVADVYQGTMEADKFRLFLIKNSLN